MPVLSAARSQARAGVRVTEFSVIVVCRKLCVCAREGAGVRMPPKQNAWGCPSLLFILSFNISKRRGDLRIPFSFLCALRLKVKVGTPLIRGVPNSTRCFGFKFENFWERIREIQIVICGSFSAEPFLGCCDELFAFYKLRTIQFRLRLCHTHPTQFAHTQKRIIMHLLGLNVSSLGAALARPVVTQRVRRSGVSRGRALNVQVRAEIKMIPSPDGVTCEEDGNSGGCENVTFREVPKFDRATAKTGIMHIGVGGFHRSHQQVRAFSAVTFCDH
jgi:hypothetical protein